MRLGGFIPVSLLDYPGKVAAVVFTQGCPFRCVYCHNPELIPSDRPGAIDEEEVISRLAVDRALLDGVCVTGGEPTSQPDLPAFLARIKALGLAVKLDTNGMHPRMVASCLEAGLVDCLAMDLKHRWERYADVIGEQAAAAVSRCRETFALIQRSGIDHEFRTTTYPRLHTAEDLHEIASHLRPGERYFIQPIRYGKTFVPDLERVPMDYAETVASLQRAYPLLEIAVRGQA
ncbi:anaerobic ribonucleoside-triphosphate reductase activating protein [Patescibacteria group bacterium]|nr:MAG: anaerobic ribonucleoside-triphosphate reductase activating protein [Patescibacteria group bacterium]